MAQGAALAALSALSRQTKGVFRGEAAVAAGVVRKQLTALIAADIIERVLPDTYRMTVVADTERQRLQAALLWAGPHAAAAGRSAGSHYRLEGLRATKPEIVLPREVRRRHGAVSVSFTSDARNLMIREHHGIRVTGPEATLVRLAHLLDDEAFEIACEDARRRATSQRSVRCMRTSGHTRGPGSAVSHRCARCSATSTRHILRVRRSRSRPAVYSWLMD